MNDQDHWQRTRRAITLDISRQCQIRDEREAVARFAPTACIGARRYGFNSVGP